MLIKYPLSCARAIQSCKLTGVTSWRCVMSNVVQKTPTTMTKAITVNSNAIEGTTESRALCEEVKMVEKQVYIRNTTSSAGRIRAIPRDWRLDLDVPVNVSQKWIHMHICLSSHTFLPPPILTSFVWQSFVRTVESCAPTFQQYL
jgi:hypothetical protein